MFTLPERINYQKKLNKRLSVKNPSFTYLLSLCAMLLCNCTEREVLIDDTPSVAMTLRQGPINFDCSYVDNAATRHSNELCNHLATMGVWGWQTDSNGVHTTTFTNQVVCHNADSARWEYSPIQYWSEGTEYSFCAYAPHQQETDAEVSIDPETHMISIHHVTLHGYNLQNEPTDAVQELFRNTPDTDWMVARAGQQAVGMPGMSVEFAMQHILAKLNVRIKVDSTLMRKRYISQITADSIIVNKLAAQGDFQQQLTHTPVLIDPAEAAINEWTVSDTTLYIKGTRECPIKETPTYLIESLVLPQYISPEAIVTLYYSFRFGNGRTEECRYRMRLNEAFARFASGHNYTLTFTISPQRIIFEAGATDWKKHS